MCASSTDKMYTYITIISFFIMQVFFQYLGLKQMLNLSNNLWNQCI